MSAFIFEIYIAKIRKIPRVKAANRLFVFLYGFGRPSTTPVGFFVLRSRKHYVTLKGKRTTQYLKSISFSFSRNFVAKLANVFTSLAMTRDTICVKFFRRCSVTFMLEVKHSWYFRNRFQKVSVESESSFSDFADKMIRKLHETFSYVVWVFRRLELNNRVNNRVK